MRLQILQQLTQRSLDSRSMRLAMELVWDAAEADLLQRLGPIFKEVKVEDYQEQAEMGKLGSKSQLLLKVLLVDALCLDEMVQSSTAGRWESLADLLGFAEEDLPELRQAAQDYRESQDIKPEDY